MEQTVLPRKLEGCGTGHPHHAKAHMSERQWWGESHGRETGRSAIQEEVIVGNENCCSRMPCRADEYINRNNEDEIR